MASDSIKEMKKGKEKKQYGEKALWKKEKRMYWIFQTLIKRL